MQTAVKLQQGRQGEDTPSGLRVGVNSAMVNDVALATLLIEKGIITEDEYEGAIADAMETEVLRIRAELGLPDNVHLH
jgi:hypothetical protein